MSNRDSQHEELNPSVSVDMDADTGRVSARLVFSKDCEECGNGLRFHTIQKSIICQECGTEWRLTI